MIRILITLATLLFASPALPHGYGVGDLIVAHPHSFPTAKTARSGIGYLTLMNNGDAADRLIEVRSPFLRATLHETVVEDGIARMIGTDGFDIPAQSRVTLEPGGKHIMFMGLDGDPLEVGERFLVTLVFERAGEIEVEFWVEDRDPDAPAMDHSQHGADHSDASSAMEGEVKAVTIVLRRRMQAQVEVPVLALSDDLAVAGWVYGNHGGRAFLRKTDGTWALALLSGASLATSSGLRAQRVSPAQAQILLAQIHVAEGSLPHAQSALLDRFQGTLIVR